MKRQPQPQPPVMPAPGDMVEPMHSARGVVIARDVRGGKPGCLVQWPGMHTPTWHPDDIDGLRVTVSAAEREGTG